MSDIHPPQKKYVDIGLVVPLKEEFQRLGEAFPTKAEAVEGAHFIAELDLGTSTISAVAILQDDMGKSAATRATDTLIRLYDLGAIVVLGIAGAISQDVSLGDVCFSDTIIDVLENTKVSDGHAGSQNLEFNSKFYTTDPLLSFAFKYVELGSDMKPFFEDWQLERYYSGEKLVPGEFIGRGSKNETLSIPRIHEGSIICGAISKSEFYNSSLKQIERKALALETESGGVFHAAAQAGVPSISVRGVCDYADKNKGKLEEQTHGKIREIAAENVASFLKLQIRNPQFQKFLANRRQKHNSASAPLLAVVSQSDLANEALKQSRETIHEQLTQLSPQYQGKPPGYRLPLPRVKRAAAIATVRDATENADPVSVLEAVTSNRVTLLDIPQSYPDSSLPWIIAGEMANIEIDGRQVLPIVIDGDSLKPPHGTISAHCEIDLVKLASCTAVRPAFIVVEFPASTRNRTEFLKAEIDKYPDSRFIFVNREALRIKEESDLRIITGAERYDVKEISFAEMTAFFQRSFQLPDQEAGVVAHRLQSMFRRFRLDAHPTYFAGVASEVLTALLRANRRAELLQLAVSGFLSFVVATDKADIVLSRTTREEFLRQLIFAKKVEKKQFNQSALVKFVAEFATKRDYDIDALKFISSFQDRHIIHFDTEGAQISLPFMEAYLLAAELATRPKDAARYFDPAAENLDITTLDVYAELGPDSGVISAVIAAVEAAIPLLDIGNAQHVLLTDEIHPALLNRRSRHQSVRERLNNAAQDVMSGRPNSGEKQKLLDLAERVEDEARSAQEAARKSQADQGNSADNLAQPLRVWSAAITLLGSGSERLDKAPKRALAASVARLTSLLMHPLCKLFADVKFDSIKSTLEDSDAIRTILGVNADTGTVELHREFVSAILDAYEFSFMSYPVRALLETLGNAAGQPVLRPSVASVETSDPMEDLVARVWAAEIDASKEGPNLERSIAKLPNVPFLRYTLAHYFMTRVYWDHWERANRLALLDAANTAIRPLQQQFDKGRIKREIDRARSVENE